MFILILQEACCVKYVCDRLLVSRLLPSKTFQSSIKSQHLIDFDKTYFTCSIFCWDVRQLGKDWVNNIVSPLCKKLQVLEFVLAVYKKNVNPYPAGG